MQQDPLGRDTPVNFTCDGTPLFKDRNAGSCIFGTITHGALDARLSREPDLAHCKGVYLLTTTVTKKTRVY